MKGMEWLVDTVFEMVMAHMSGMIQIWSGAIVDIPEGWVLCDGNNGTPDLRDKFVIGAGDTYAPDASGGAVNHTHDFTSDQHRHETQLSNWAVAGTGAWIRNSWWTQYAVTTGTTDADGSLPPYYALAYIMKT